jgi:hypothetical protein
LEGHLLKDLGHLCFNFEGKIGNFLFDLVEVDLEFDSHVRYLAVYFIGPL